MKFSVQIAIAFSCALLAAGCTRFYNITTGTGRVITSRGKPHYDKENAVFLYTDARGEKRSIPAGSVVQISPASDKSSPTSFNPAPAR